MPKIKRLQKEREIFNGYYYDLPDNMETAIQWLQAKLAQVPVEHKDTAKLVFDVERAYYDNVTTSIRIFYYSEETDEEMKERWQAEIERTAALRERELLQLAALQRKYKRAASDED